MTITNCPGNITGTITRQSDGAGLGGYNMRLYEDFNNDGLPDGAAVRNVFSTGTGGWAMASLYPGTYILEQANGAFTQTISITDDGTSDGIVDPMIPVAPITNPANTAVQLPVRKLGTNGDINIIMNL